MVFISILVFAALKIIDGINANKRAGNTPPTIQVQSPQAGETFIPGEAMFVLASALGRTPIQYIELWFDSASIGKVFNDQLNSDLFPAEFTVEITEGSHTLYVRAVDQEGLIAQSIPIPVYGSAELAEGAVSVYPSQEGENLEGIADEFGVDEGAVKDLNPSIGDGTLPAGTMITLPPEANGEPEAQPPAATAPQPAPAGGQTGVSFLPVARATNPIIDAFKSLTQLKPPAAPSDLQASMDGCSLVLTWMDNAADENHYNIWISGLGVPARILDVVSSSEHTGRVWYKFTTPTSGIYNFWVEAENVIGSQPGEAVWIGVPPMECGDTVKTAGFLFLVVERFEVFGSYDRVYCYLSVEGAPEIRFPDDDSLFFSTQPQGETPASTVYWGGINTLVLQYPEDNVLDLEGECMAWSGATLNSLGKFNAKLSPEGETFRDEFRDSQYVETPNFNIWFFVRPYGWETPQESSYTYFDPTLPVPYNLQLVDTGKRGNPFHPTDKILKWDWNGDPDKILGFTVWLNGKAYKSVGASTHEVYLPPPAVCGADVEIDVTASTFIGNSAHSETLEYSLEPCRALAEIQLISMHVFRSTRTGVMYRNDCASLPVRYALWGSGAYEVAEKFFGYPYSLHDFVNELNKMQRLIIKCNKFYDFSKIGHTDRILVPIDPNNPKLVFGLYMQSRYSGHIVWIKDEISLPLDKWNGFDDVREYNQDKEGAHTSTVIRIRGYIDVGQ